MTNTIPIQKSQWIAIGILVILYTVGAVSTIIGYEELLKLSSVNLLLTLFLVLWFQPKTKAFVVYAFIVYFAGFFIELAGITTGKIFGQYFYGNNLGIKLWDVPIVIGVNWLLLSYSSVSVTAYLAKRISMVKKAWVFSLVASVAMVGIDALIEPLCARLDFWYWKGGDIPLTNFTAWFLFSVAFNYLGVKLGVHQQNNVGIAAWLLQVLFFVSLTIFLV